MIVEVTRSFAKELKKLPKATQKRVLIIIDILNSSNNLQETNLSYKKLEGQHRSENYYRIRDGNYRIGCQLKNPNILFITIFHRQNDYKKFP